MFQKNDRLVENFSLEYETGNFHSRILKKKFKSVLFWLDCATDLSSFRKTATLGRRGGFEEFSLV